MKRLGLLYQRLGYLLTKIILVSLILLITIYNFPSVAADTTNGAKIFSINCAGCHPQGSNIIRRGKTLKKRALHKYNMDSLEAISYLVTNGKGNMSAYQDHLSQKEIEDVSAYVLEQADKNWN